MILSSLLIGVLFIALGFTVPVSRPINSGRSWIAIMFCQLSPACDELLSGTKNATQLDRSDPFKRPITPRTGLTLPSKIVLP